MSKGKSLEVLIGEETLSGHFLHLQVGAVMGQRNTIFRARYLTDRGVAISFDGPSPQAAMLGVILQAQSPKAAIEPDPTDIQPGEE